MERNGTERSSKREMERNGTTTENMGWNGTLLDAGMERNGTLTENVELHVQHEPEGAEGVQGHHQTGQRGDLHLSCHGALFSVMSCGGDEAKRLWSRRVMYAIMSSQKEANAAVEPCRVMLRCDVM